MLRITKIHIFWFLKPINKKFKLRKWEIDIKIISQRDSNIIK